MSAYPDTLPQSERTKLTPDSGIKTTRSQSGLTRGTSFYDVEAIKITVVHPLLTDAEKATLEQFYAVNKLLEFTFNYKAEAPTKLYTVMFTAPPTFQYVVDGRWDATSQLEGRA